MPIAMLPRRSNSFNGSLSDHGLDLLSFRGNRRTCLCDTAIAQQRIMLQTIDFPPGYETVIDVAVLRPGNCTSRHTHPGAESAYVLEGEAVAKVDGKPDLSVKAGQPLQFAPGAVHSVCNSSGRPVQGSRPLYH